MKRLTVRQQKIIANMQSEISDKIYNLNYGGCGRFAYLFHKHIVKIFPDAKIVAFDNQHDDMMVYRNNINCVMNNGYVDDNSMVPTHMMIKIANHFIDGYKTIYDKNKKCEYRYYIGEYTNQELEIALKHGNWNKWYDKTQNKKLSKIIDKHISMFNLKESDKKLTTKKSLSKRLLSVFD